MVSSGLVDRVDVSHYRLSLHLVLAFIILTKSTIARKLLLIFMTEGFSYSKNKWINNYSPSIGILLYLITIL